MDALQDWIGPLSVTARAVLAAVAGLLGLAILIWLTSLLTRWRRAIAIWAVILVAGILALVYTPVDTQELVASPAPASEHDAALARFDKDLRAAPEPLNPLCEPFLRSHGEKTRTVVVLLHGVSSCPRAFVEFAPVLHERGHNVMAVRMPRNGYADRATDALNQLTAEELARFGDTVVDTAAGLGEEVVFLGISAGGTVAGWAAQNRPEVDRAVLVAPFYGLGSFGPGVNVMLMRAMLLLPDISIWKDPVRRERAEGGMAHAYLRQSTRATGEIMRLGLGTYRQARQDPPSAGEIVVITNDADTAVSNATTQALTDLWRSGGAVLTTYEFAAEHGLGHELIDPEEPGANPALTYPVIVQLVEEPAAFEGGDPIAAGGDGAGAGRAEGAAAAAD